MLLNMGPPLDISCLPELATLLTAPHLPLGYVQFLLRSPPSLSSLTSLLPGIPVSEAIRRFLKSWTFSIGAHIRTS